MKWASEPKLFKISVHIILIASAGFLAYSNTFNVPFQWDEPHFIEANPVIKNPAYFLDPSKAKGLEYYDALKSRYIGYLSFALNYRANGFDVAGYHVVNLVIHITNAVLVYLLVLLTFNTPFLARSSLVDDSNQIAFFSAMLFVAHPVQTEAVTYIFQRLASLVSMFYLASLICYIKWRLNSAAEQQRSRVTGLLTPVLLRCCAAAPYLFSVLFSFLAMKTKENAFTLPLVITLFEFSFFTGTMKRRILFLAPLLMTLLIIPLTMIDTAKPLGEIIGGMPATARGYQAISRHDYFFTQVRVVVTYMRLLFLPVNQNIAYHYPLYPSFFSYPVLLSFVFLSVTMLSGVYLFRDSRTKDKAFRLIAFGIFWFFITLTVESSVIPIPMIICEYRVYLPSVGAIISLVSGIFLLMKKFEGNRRMRYFVKTCLITAVAVFSVATYSRNAVWESRISLWEDTVSKSPRRIIAREMLSSAYLLDGLPDRAIEQIEIIQKQAPDYPDVYYHLSLCYRFKGMMDKAVEYMETYLRFKPDDAQAHQNLGIFYGIKGLTDTAIQHFQTALKLKPDYARARDNLGVAYASKGLIDQAIEQYQASLALDPDSADAHYDLGRAYFEKGMLDTARGELEAALKINPDYQRAGQLLGRITAR